MVIRRFALASSWPWPPAWSTFSPWLSIGPWPSPPCPSVNLLRFIHLPPQGQTMYLLVEARPAGLILLCVIGVIVAIGYALYCYDMAKNRPEEWQAWCQRAHEQRLLNQRLRYEREQQERLRQEAARRSRNGMLF